MIMTAMTRNWIVAATEMADENGNFVPTITLHYGPGAWSEAIERVRRDLASIAPTMEEEASRSTPSQLAQLWREMTNGDCIFGPADFLREMVAAADAKDAAATAAE